MSSAGREAELIMTSEGELKAHFQSVGLKHETRSRIDMRRDIAKDPPPTAVSQGLVQNAQRGDTAAFEEIYRLTCSRVYTQCLHLMRDPAEAEDLTQEVFLQVYRKIATYRGESAFATWLHHVTLNCVLMRFRRKALPTTPMDSVESGVITHPEERQEFGREDAHLVDSPERLALLAAIARLAPGYRAMIYLHDIFGYEHHEIAEIMNCSVGNSKSQLHMARLKIREQLLTSKAGTNALCERHLGETVMPLLFRRRHGARTRRACQPPVHALSAGLLEFVYGSAIRKSASRVVMSPPGCS